MTDITQTPEFQKWFAGSKVVDQNGRPLKLYRGLRGETTLQNIDRMEPRPKYAMFFTNNPYVAATYGNLDGWVEWPDEGAAIFPVYVKCPVLHEFPTKKDWRGHTSFDMFKFDEWASRLRPGEGIVARGIVDIGPRANNNIDPEMRYSYASDTYSFGRGTSIKSAVAATKFDIDDPRMTEGFVNIQRGYIMTKTFHEILAEKDEEYTYTVRSTANIHDGELYDRIRFAFLPYRVKLCEPESYTPLSRGNKWFPNEPNSPCFSVRVVTGLPVPTASFIQTLAMTLRIHQSHLMIEGDEDIETDPVNQPEEIDSEYSQSLVGTKRIADFVRELQADRKEREAKAITREVYECYFTTHRGLENLTKQPARKGYYFVKRFSDNIMEVVGPYVNRPTDRNLYRDRIIANNPKIISENTEDGLSNLQILVDAIDDAQIPGERMYEVGVQDLESGRRFSSVVSALTPNDARKLAVRQVAEENRLDPNSLTALAPREKK